MSPMAVFVTVIPCNCDGVLIKLVCFRKGWRDFSSPDAAFVFVPVLLHSHVHYQQSWCEKRKDASVGTATRLPAR
jgi:hypothetical protein